MAFEKTARMERFNSFTLYLDFGRDPSILIVLKELFVFFKEPGIGIKTDGLHILCYHLLLYIGHIIEQLPSHIFISTVRKEGYTCTGLF